MELLDFIFIALFAGLFFSKHTKLASSVFILCTALFLVMDYLLPDAYSYAASGTVNLIIFLTLVAYKSRTYFLVAILSACLILVNLQGYWDYENYLKPDKYNNAYFILLTAQLVLLYMRALVNGLIDRFNFKRDLVQFIINSNLEAFDSYLYSKDKEADK